MRPGDHLCLVHETAAEREAVLSVFIADGLLDRQKVLLLRPADEADGSGAPGGEVLATQGLDPEPYLASGRLEARAAGSGRGAAAALVSEVVSAALRSGAPAVRVCRDAPRTLPADRLRMAEAELAAAVSGLPVLTLCAYSQVAFTAAEIRGALDDHGEGTVELDPLYEDGLLRVVRRFTPPALRADGDIDASNVVHLARVLSSECGRLSERPVAGPDGRPVPLRLEADGLDFIDVSGMRLLVQTASRLHAEGGRRLALVGLAPHLRRVMRVVGWDLTPGLELVGDCGDTLPATGGPDPPGPRTPDPPVTALSPGG
jgi:anti-anti-sigma factor